MRSLKARRSPAKLAVRTTSLGSRSPPPGTGAFQSRPKSVRSIVPESSSAIRSFPRGSVPAPSSCPLSSTGVATPLIVSSPSTMSWFPRASTRVDSNRSSGYRSASKKSGDCRCASRVSSNVVMLDTAALPSIDGASPPRIVPSKSSARPLITASPIFLISKPSADQTGSIVHVPVGMMLADFCATMDIAALLCVHYN